MKRRLAAILATLALLGVMSAQTVTATHVDPVELTPGNYQCPSGSTKIDPVTSGTYDLVGGGSITIDVSSTPKGPVFSFTTSGATVSAVVVKGGPNYHSYLYAPSVTTDDGLHAPLNLNNNKWYGLSHLCFESAKKDSGGGKK
jgi:hypothetical protein